jgi:hypothetical protein
MADRDARPTQALSMGSAGLRAGDWPISGMAGHTFCHIVDGSLVLDHLSRAVSMSRDWKDYWPFRLKSEQRRFHGIPHEPEDDFHDDELLRAAGSLTERPCTTLQHLPAERS